MTREERRAATRTELLDAASRVFAQRGFHAATEDTPGARTRAAARRWMELVHERPEMFLLLLEYWAYSMRHPELRPAVVERFGAFRDTTARWVEVEAKRGGWDLPPPASDIAVGINALTFGMALQYLPCDDELPDDALEQMALAMLTGIREWTLERRKPRRGR
jgi:AcrR family transcriptional regulator